MADLEVTTQHLAGLANIFDQAAGMAEKAKRETVGIPRDIETTWGPLFRAVNDQFIHAEHEHHRAVKHIQDACVALAEQLNSAAEAYLNSDILPACTDSDPRE
ncbi:MAG: ESX-1 secretion-associated protein [Mycobacteriaceae bacterium]|nr:ESX-1 secretion-associated protein [Mycobacteriaceae bacterium]